MNKTKRIAIFVFLVVFFFICCFLINYKIDVYDLKVENLYTIFQDEHRDFLNIKIKNSKVNKYNCVTVGTSSTHSLFVVDKTEIPVIILYGFSYKEMYEVVKTYFFIHPETKKFILPLEYHTMLQYSGVYNIKKFDYKNTLSIEEFIRSYLGLDMTKKNLLKLFNDFKVLFKKNDQSDEIPFQRYERFTKNRLSKGTVITEEQVSEKIEYLNKIIDFLETNNIEIICFVVPYNYAYMQDMMSDYNLNVVEKIEKAVVDRGIQIYDFSAKNKYNETFMTKTYLFSDIMHPNFVYGRIISDILLDKPSKLNDKSLYRISDKNTLHQNMQLLKSDIKIYKRDNKESIKEYETWDNSGKIPVDFEMVPIPWKELYPNENIGDW